MVAGLCNVAQELAQRVADGLGMPLPEPLPKVLSRPPRPEVTASPALSLLARPGEKAIKTRHIAILVANGLDGQSALKLHGALARQGAVVRFVGAALGRVESVTGDPIEVEMSLDTGPSVVYDAVVLPHGEKAVKELSQLGLAKEFLKDQYRHCKTILALGASSSLLEAIGISATLPDGTVDPGVLLAVTRDMDKALDRFVQAVVKHRHFERETDPPRI